MIAHVLVDSNVLLDVIKADPLSGGWSAQALARHQDRDARRYRTYFPGLALISPDA